MDGHRTVSQNQQSTDETESLFVLTCEKAAADATRDKKRATFIFDVLFGVFVRCKHFAWKNC
jgi:hypothetical protein